MVRGPRIGVDVAEKACAWQRGWSCMAEFLCDIMSSSLDVIEPGGPFYLDTRIFI